MEVKFEEQREDEMILHYVVTTQEGYVTSLLLKKAPHDPPQLLRGGIGGVKLAQGQCRYTQILFALSTLYLELILHQKIQRWVENEVQDVAKR